MAIVDRIFFHGTDILKEQMTVYVRLHPAGEVRLDVKIPEVIFNSVMRVARTAAEHHEAQMQAQLIGEKDDESVENPQPLETSKEVGTT